MWEDDDAAYDAWKDECLWEQEPDDSNSPADDEPRRRRTVLSDEEPF